MSVPTKTHHTKNIEHNNKLPKPKNETYTSWDNTFNELLKTHSEQGLYLKGLRIREGYTQKKLGELINVSQNNISAMEHGARAIGKDIAQRFAAIFKVKYQRFL